jgi:cytochrome c peroxidase
MGFPGKWTQHFLLAACVAGALAPLACGDDDPGSPSVSDGGAGGQPAPSGAGGEPTSPGGSSDGGSGNDSGASGVAGEGGTGGIGGMAGVGGETEGGAGGVVGMIFPPYPEVSFPQENPFSLEKAILGKILFWDEQMSSDNTVACGTCHRAGSGGTDPRGASPASRHPGATADPQDDIHGAQGIKRCTIAGNVVTYKADAVFGLNVQVTSRRPPSYLDAMFAPDIFWDGRAKTTFIDPDTGQIAIGSGGGLESQSVGPPLADTEMACEGRKWTDIHAKLKTAVPLKLAHDLPADMKAALAAAPTYPDLFEAAYGTPEINTKRIAFAIATHERRLTSKETPWDRFNAGEVDAFTPAMRRGYELFLDKGKCTPCHAPPLFTDGVFHNLGFIASDFDKGRQVVSGQALDKGKVKTSTLRNVGLREPGGLLHFGHGPGATLDAVMAAYNQPPMFENTDISIQPLFLTPDEIADMLTFMRDGLTDPRVAAELPPFDRPKLGSEP